MLIHWIKSSLIFLCGVGIGAAMIIAWILYVGGNLF